MYNIEKLTQELANAGILFSGCNDSGIVWGVDGVTEIQSQPAVQAILLAHDPIDYITEPAFALASEADALLRAVPEWATWDTTQAVSYIETNVTTLASAKVVLVAMAKMIIALRNKTFSKVVIEGQNK